MEPATCDEDNDGGDPSDARRRFLSCGEDPAVAGLRAAIDRLAAERPAPGERAALGDGNRLATLVRQLHRLQAVVDAETADFAASGEWAADGARSAAAWLAERCRMPKTVARRSVGLGKAAHELPVAAAAWMDGEISPAHVHALAAFRRPGTRQALLRDEEVLVGHARNLSYRAFRQLLAYWEQHVDPDGCEEAGEMRRARRDVRLSTSFDGMCLGNVTLDAVSGDIVLGELRRLEQALFEADWAAAKADAGEGSGAEAGGEGAPLRRLARTPAQRRADALVEMAIRSRSAPPGARRPAPLLTVLVDYPTLHGRVCELADGAVVTPGDLLPWITQADVERAVFGSDGRIEISETSRFFRGATRRAIEVRDRRCTHPMCDEPAAWCEVDHVVPWEVGGPTTQQNGRLLCRFHHRMRQGRPPPVPG